MFFRTSKEQIEFACAECSDFAPLEHPIKRLFMKFSATDLINYLRENPDVCQKTLEQSSDKRYSPSTFILPTRKNFLIGKTRYKNPTKLVNVQSFDNIEEAVADYILWNWRLPRLRPSRTEHVLKTVMEKEFSGTFTYVDENENVFDYADITVMRFEHGNK